MRGFHVWFNEVGGRWTLRLRAAAVSAAQALSAADVCLRPPNTGGGERTREGSRV
jgi:hypothetical protein